MLVEQDVKDWIVAYIADYSGVPQESVKLDTPFSHYGLDSSDAVIVGGALEERFDVEIDATLFLRNEDIASLLADLKANGAIAG